MSLKFALTVAIPLKHEIPGQSKVIPGYLDTSSKSVKSLDCPGHPWTVGNYGYNYFFSASVSLGLLVSMNIIQSHNAVEALAPVIF